LGDAEPAFEHLAASPVRFGNIGKTQPFLTHTMRRLRHLKGILRGESWGFHSAPRKTSAPEVIP
jgi:hypothetical protein